MKTDTKKPYMFFEDLLQENKIIDLKLNFISNFVEDYRSFEIESIDNEQGIIKFWNSYQDEITLQQIVEISVYDFEDYFNALIVENYKTSKKKTDELLFEICVNGNTPKIFIASQIEFLNNLRTKAESIYSERPIIKKHIKLLIKHLLENRTEIEVDHITPNLIDREDYAEYSLNWDSARPEDTIPNISKLFVLLTQSPLLIECSQEEFINAFTKRKIFNGIRWLVKGPNKSISKSSLVYFVRRLIEEEYIENIPESSLNKTIQYVFRDSDGQTLKNIKQTIYAMTDNPTQKDRIELIISRILR